MGPDPAALTEPFAARYVNRFRPDVVYTPMQTMGPWGRRFGLVTTVHDLIYYSNRTPPREFPWWVRLAWRIYHLSWAPQRGLLKRSDAHATVSRTTRSLMEQHRLTTHPITVVSNAVDAVGEPRAAAGGRDLLYMGSFMPYKNVELLARAMHQLPGYTLHLLSRASDDARTRLTALAPAGSLVFHGGVTDAEYESLLARSMALVSASLNEGFGLPLVEAMATGTPVVVSDIDIFREIGGDAAVLFDPHSAESFAEAVHRLDDPEEWRRRSRLSVERAADFSWDRSAAALLDVLREVHLGRGGSPD